MWTFFTFSFSFLHSCDCRNRSENVLSSTKCNYSNGCFSHFIHFLSLEHLLFHFLLDDGNSVFTLPTRNQKNDNCVFFFGRESLREHFQGFLVWSYERNVNDGMTSTPNKAAKAKTTILEFLLFSLLWLYLINACVCSGWGLPYALVKAILVIHIQLVDRKTTKVKIIFHAKLYFPSHLSNLILFIWCLFRMFRPKRM